ncbi:uncharacterized protein LOC115342418 [Aquila chrysaetos chrysaetos]|uniref:uncharacterized protein LOC115342418 n=1 Tax=Aquila chrysaetos chrysaetos TaxID=223781 RepID=UPI001B7D41BF|nr:uncharacterized protein LOC115342418 [Aquila chrysaetos chrysaetos]
MSFRDMLTVISWRWIMMLSTHSVHLPLLPACLAVHSDSSPVFSPFPPPCTRLRYRVLEWKCQQTGWCVKQNRSQAALLHLRGSDGSSASRRPPSLGTWASPHHPSSAKQLKKKRFSAFCSFCRVPWPQAGLAKATALRHSPMEPHERQESGQKQTQSLNSFCEGLSYLHTPNVEISFRKGTLVESLAVSAVVLHKFSRKETKFHG